MRELRAGRGVEGGRVGISQGLSFERMVPSLNGFGFRVPDFGFRVPSFGCRVPGSGFQVSGFGSKVSGFEFGVSGFGSGLSGFELGVSSCGFRISGFEFRVSSLGFGVPGVGPPSLSDSISAMRRFADASSLLALLRVENESSLDL